MAQLHPSNEHTKYVNNDIVTIISKGYDKITDDEIQILISFKEKKCARSSGEFLKKFKAGGFNKLLSKWTPFYFKKQNVFTNFNHFKAYLRTLTIEALCYGITDRESIDWNERKKVGQIQQNYHEMFYDGDPVDPGTLRETIEGKRIENTRKTVKTQVNDKLNYTPPSYISHVTNITAKGGVSRRHHHQLHTKKH